MRKLRFSIFFAAMTFAAAAAADPSFVPALKTNFPDAFVLPHGGEFIAYSTNDGANVPVDGGLEASINAEVLGF